MSRKHTLVAILAMMASLVASLTFAPARAADWPQWLGPDRTGISTETGLLKSWPKEGPKLKWKVKDLGGDGYSSVAVVQGLVYTLMGLDGDEYVVALAEADGKRAWTTKIGKIGPNNEQASYPGPRSTPTIDSGKLYALGSGGDLACLDPASGKSIWAKNLHTDFAGQPGSWAYAESPLVDGNAVIVSPGGPAATVVALNKNDGSVTWKSSIPAATTAGYGSPIRIEVGGVKQYVCFLNGGLFAVDASDGKFSWRFQPVGKSGDQVANIPTPLFHKDMVFATSSLGQGGGAVKLTAVDGKVTATQAYLNDQLKAQIGGFLRIGDYLYGTPSGVKNPQLLCAEFATGEIVWKNVCVGPGAMCVADGLLYFRGQDGNATVALLDPSPGGYKELARFDQPDRSKRPAWPYPVVANGALYLRDCGVLLCYDVRDPNVKR